MKVGDRLYCYKNYLVTTKYSGNNVNWLNITIGRSYVIQRSDTANRIYFISDDGSSRWVTSDEISHWYYGKWFYTLRDIRKIKLDLIKIF